MPHPVISGRRSRLTHSWSGWVILAVTAFLIGCSQMPRHGITSSGTGGLAYSQDGPVATPVVVLQSGLGDGRASWTTIWPRLTAKHRVFALDRPGYGESRPSTSPRDPCTAAGELREALLEARLPPPYLLVGHSLGGLYQYVFARLYPQDTAGLLLLDPTHPDHWATLQRETPHAATALRGLRATLFSAAMRAEFDDQTTCLDRLPRPPPLAIPSRLLVSTRFGALESESFRHALHRLRLDWQRLLDAPAVEAVAASGHYIHHDAPERVIQTIAEMIARDGPARR